MRTLRRLLFPRLLPALGAVGVLLADDVLAVPPTYETHVVFDNSLSDRGYYHSETYLVPPSALKQADGKIPVAADRFASPPNALKLSWTSATGGDWRATIEVPTRYARQFEFEGDTLSFWCYSDSEITEENSPLLFVRDTEKLGSPATTLVHGDEKIPAGKWTEVRIPVTAVRSLTGSTDERKFNPRKLASVSFMQGLDDGRPHSLYVDEFRIVPAATSDHTPPDAPASLTATGYERHVDLAWNPSRADDVLSYRIYRSEDGRQFSPVGTQEGRWTRYEDFSHRTGQQVFYKVTALDVSGNESPMSQEAHANTRPMSDDELLEMVQKACFRYYWEAGHPNSGLAPEIMPGDPKLAAVGGNGFGIMALLVAVERRFVTRQEGAERMLKIARFLASADRFHGVWPHFLDSRTGKTIPYFGAYDDGGDLVETAFAIQGLLAARQYFDRDNPVEKEIRETATRLWREVEWDWYRREPQSDVLFWHWSPDHGFHIGHPLIGWNETLIVYLLAIASPTHPVPASLYHSGWAGRSERAVRYRRTWSRTTQGDHFLNGNEYYGIKLEVGEGNGSDLFFTHFSFMGFDPRGIRDAYTNYFLNNRAIALINRAYCVENPRKFAGYGPDCWGLSAGVNSGGGRPLPRDDNGTINCMASLSSMPYTPAESLAALKHFYRDLGPKVYGPFGFYDGFNESENWFEVNYMALNQAPIVVMIENERSGLVWKKFMANPEIAPALKAIGFKFDPAEK
ncbi:hypothetical protein DB347_10040 [Opitutaceae bacterium EW11]|nr:hypothetical protein DB347_10040 [Opitutaceae bacterium EW11]